ncbi:MAG TPA: tetratricopeptide repeat protein, partial [Bacteroidia bacterium]|nr:tetratricopeptide repeat protein [Bacteroidia bacterium]
FGALHFFSFSQNPHVDSLLKSLQLTGQDTARANILQELVNTYITELNDTKKASEASAEQLALSQKLHFKKGIAFGYLNRGTFYRSAGNAITALMYDQKSLVLMLELKNKLGESASYSNIGLDHCQNGNYEEALNCFLKSQQIREQLNDKIGLTNIYSNMANLYAVQGNYTKSLLVHLKGLKIREELGDKIGISKSYTNIGNIFYWQEKYSEALNYYYKSVTIKEELNDKVGLSSVYINIGGIYTNQKKYAEALATFFKSLRVLESIQNKRNVAGNYISIAIVYTKLKNWEQAKNYNLKAVAVLNGTGNKRELLQAYTGLGDAYRDTGHYKKALTYYEQALSLAKELKTRDLIKDIYESLSVFYKKQKQFEKAFEYTILYNNEKDSILNKENFRQVAELNTRYETEKKENEILLLTKDQELNAKIIHQQRLVRIGLISGLILLFIAVLSIFRRYRFKRRANDLLQIQKNEIQEKNILITDSIDYAKTIQETVLPTHHEIKKVFPKSFIVFKPKSIVSGDFYWIYMVGEMNILAVADCTGHGVPGAFMSLLLFGLGLLMNDLILNIIRVLGALYLVYIGYRSFKANFNTSA